MEKFEFYRYCHNSKWQHFERERATHAGKFYYVTIILNWLAGVKSCSDPGQEGSSHHSQLVVKFSIRNVNFRTGKKPSQMFSINFAQQFW